MSISREDSATEEKDFQNNQSLNVEWFQQLPKTWMICSTVEEDDKVVRGPRVLIEVDQHLQHDHEDDIGDVDNEHLSPVENGRVGLHLWDWVLGVEDVNDRHSAFKSTEKKKNFKDLSSTIFVQQSEMDFFPIFHFIFVRFQGGSVHCLFSQ